MAFDEKIEKGASILFDDDPLANMAARGLYRGGSALGRAANAGLTKLKGNRNYPEADEPARELPQRDTGGDFGSPQQDFGWLKDVLSNIANDISLIRQSILEQTKTDQDNLERERLRLREDELENKNKSGIEIKKDAPAEKQAGILGLLGTALSGIFSTITTFLSNPAVVAALALLAASSTDKDSIVRTVIGDISKWIKDKIPGMSEDTPVAAVSVNDMTRASKRQLEKNKRLRQERAAAKRASPDRRLTKSERREARRQARRLKRGKMPNAGSVAGVADDAAKAAPKSLMPKKIPGARAIPLAGAVLSGMDRVAEGQGTTQVVGGVGAEMAGGWAGAEIGAALGAFGGPAAPVTIPLGALIGGIGGALGAGSLFDLFYESSEAYDKNPEYFKHQEELKRDEEESDFFGDLFGFGDEESVDDLKKSNEELEKSTTELKSSTDNLVETLKNNGSGSISPNTNTGPVASEEAPKSVQKGPAGKGLPKSQQQFYNNMYDTLLTEAKKAGVKNPEAIARLGTAQSSLETQYGQHLAAGNNYFGIKDETGKGEKLSTKEFIDGRWVTIKDSFRKYNNMQESAADYIKFLQKNPRYAEVLNASTTDQTILAQSKTGYATDPGYRGKLDWITRHGMAGANATVKPIPKEIPDIERATPEQPAPKAIPIPFAMPTPAPGMQLALAGGSEQKESAVNCTIDGSVRAACG